MKAQRLLQAAALAAATVLAAAGPAAAYPDRPITLLVGFPAGGNVDIAARQVQPFLEKYLGGARIAVVNKPGAAGALMNTELANAAPDGYTLGMLSFPGVFTLLFGAEARYGVDSFEYVANITDEPFTIFVNNDTPYQSLKDIVEAATARPGEITLAGAGAGSAPHVGVMAFERMTGAKFNWVPMQGAANMRTAVLGGHVDGGVTTVSVSVVLDDEKQARTLGMFADERWDKAPDLQTAKENGWDFAWSASRGIAAPKGTPEAILAKLEDAIRQIHADPEFQALAERDRQILRFLDREAFRSFAEAQYDMLAELWAAAPWK